MCIILLAIMAASCIYTANIKRDTFIVFSNLIMYTSAMFHSINNFIWYNINYTFIQKVTFEMIHVSESMTAHEKIVFQRYIKKCLPFYSVSLIYFYSLTVGTITVVPLLAHQPFPTVIEYPFDVLYQPLHTIIYLKQSICGFFVSAHLCVNVYMALLVWFTTARFKVLAEQLRMAVNVYELFECIKTHQKLLKYADNVSIVVRAFAFTTICCSTVGLITLFLLVLKEQSLIVISWALAVTVSGLLEVFMYTWPAEHLMHTASEIGHVAFEILDNHYFVKIWKCLQIIIMRNQKLIQISIPCLMPALSFNYFSAYLSTILSYFTTLRVAILENND
ncbi:hypothetical protein PUN28_011823 [Cardiocondyla obscurior]